MAENVQKLLTEIKAMEQIRQPWEIYFQETSELVLPSRPFFPQDAYSIQPERPTHLQVFDETPIVANEMFAAQLTAQLVSPQIRWFGLRPKDPGLQDVRDVRAWLEAVESVLRYFFEKPTFVASVHEMMLEIGAFGTAAFFVGESARTGELGFMARPLSEIFVRQDFMGRVDAVVRRFELTYQQAEAAFGPLPDELTREGRSNPNSRTTFYHYVYPREGGTVGGPAKRKPWASVTLERKTGVLLRESGFDEFPYMVPRWLRAPDETYGRGIGTTTLPGNRLLQRVMEVTIRGAQKAIDPPIIVTDDGLVGPVRTSPGKLITVRAGLRKEDRPTPFLTGARPDFGEAFIEMLRDNLLRAFFIDPGMLKTPEPRVTATAVLDSRDMRFQRMTPMIERLQAEFLVPLIDRVFGLLQRRVPSPFPPPPFELLGRELTVEFTSPAAMAQLVTEADNMSRFLTRVAPLGNLALHTIDADEFVRHMARNLSIPEAIILDPAEAQRRAQAEAASNAVQEFAAGAAGGRQLTEGLRNVAAIQQGTP